MNLEWFQLTSQGLVDLSKNSMPSTDQPSSFLVDFAGNDGFLQQLQQEFNNYGTEVAEQKLPVSGNYLPSEEGADNDLSIVKELNQEESDLLLSDELTGSNVTLAAASSTPVQPVLTPLDIKINQQQAALNNKPVDVQLENSEATNDETYTNLLDEEITEAASELIPPELNRKKQAFLDSQSGDVKPSRGEATLVMSSMTSNLSLSSKTAESMPNLNASLESAVSDHEAWGDELSNRMAWMVRQDIKVANLRLNPADLGPVEIRIQIKNEQVDVHFNSTHAQVRDAIEVAVPRLRDMFGEQLLRLDNVNVSQHSFDGQNERSRDHASELLAEGEGNTHEDEALELSEPAVIAQGKIDYFV